MLCAIFDPEEPRLREYLEKVTWYSDAFFDRCEGGIKVIGGMHKWVIPCNWKFRAENFSGDSYHVPWSHLSAIRSGFSFGANTRPEAAGRIVSPGNGHAIVCVGPNNVTEPPMRRSWRMQRRSVRRWKSVWDPGWRW